MVAVLPPQTASEPPPPGEVPVCLTHPDQPAVWISPTGYPFCQACRQSWDNLGFDQLYPAYENAPYEPVDLRALMTGERPDEDWMVEPLLPAGKLCGIVSKRGEGKSILLLDIAAAKATGQPVLAQAAGPPTHVIYIDMEMGPDDLYQRLESLGYTPTHPEFNTLIVHLHYYQLIALPPLNTEEGGHALEDLVDRHQATLVIIDTVSRVVSGEENSAEPYRDLFRHTETMLKRRRVTLARLDHLGKDTGRGSRGSSAKEDPLDVVWQLEETIVADTLSLTLTKGRQPWIPRHVTIHRVDQGENTTHQIYDDVAPEWLVELAGLVDNLGLDPKATVNETQATLKQAGRAKSRKVASQVARFRKGRRNGSEPFPGQFSEPSENRQNRTQETLTNIEEIPRNRSGNYSEPFSEPGSPPKGGNRSEPPQNYDLDDDFQPDPADLPDPYEED